MPYQNMWENDCIMCDVMEGTFLLFSFFFFPDTTVETIASGKKN